MGWREAHGRKSGVQASAAGGEVVVFGGVAGQQQGLVVGEALLLARNTTERDYLTARRAGLDA